MAPTTVKVGGKEVKAGRFEVRGSGKELKVKCPKCGKWDSVENYFLRDKGTRLYAHKPCEIARSIASKKKGDGGAKPATRKTSARKTSTKRGNK
jgi:hypothetical protein